MDKILELLAAMYFSTVSSKYFPWILYRKLYNNNNNNNNNNNKYLCLLI